MELAARVAICRRSLRILDALYIPTGDPHSLPDGPPADHFGRLQIDEALRHARALVDAIRGAMA